METELWICPECLEKYNLDEAPGGECKMGICPMCHEYRNLVKAEPLKETMPTKEGLEWLSQAQATTDEKQPSGF